MSTILILLLGVGLVQILRGPTPMDRLLAAQLLGTMTVAIILTLDGETLLHHYIDIALLLALLASVTAVAFVRKSWDATKS